MASPARGLAGGAGHKHAGRVPPAPADDGPLTAAAIRPYLPPQGEAARYYPTSERQLAEAGRPMAH